jgi:hypothetical protein
MAEVRSADCIAFRSMSDGFNAGREDFSNVKVAFTGV